MTIIKLAAVRMILYTKYTRIDGWLGVAGSWKVEGGSSVFIFRVYVRFGDYTISNLVKATSECKPGHKVVFLLCIEVLK